MRDPIYKAQDRPYGQEDINDLIEKGRGPDKEPRAKRGTGIKKQPWDESVKDTPEYDIKLQDKKTAKIKSELDAAKAEYKKKYGHDYGEKKD